MKTNIFILLLLILTAFGWTYYSATQKPKTDTKNVSETLKNQTLTPSANFTYTTLKGRTGTLFDLKGKVILLHFWASWCAPCIIEFPDLIDLANNQSENLTILAISTDSNKTDINKFLKKLSKPIPSNMILAQDPNKTISQDLYQTIKLPETYLITPELQISEKIIGPQDNWNSHIWFSKIEALTAP